ncbi:hypothetical protein ACO2Q1_04925 [Brevundimonas sp. VNH65]|uniref:hypothetical protein n=1 Tax=Brevundimonas sp. VNH65 TaxID=3400917 RepID=UPI003C0FE5AB
MMRLTGHPQHEIPLGALMPTISPQFRNPSATDDAGITKKWRRNIRAHETHVFAKSFHLSAILRPGLACKA